MNDSALNTIEQVETFLTATATMTFRFENAAAGYAWIQATLARFGYARLRRPHKGILRRYLQAVTGYSRAQVTRLIQGFQKTGRVQRHAGVRHRFAVHYTPADDSHRAGFPPPPRKINAVGISAGRGHPLAGQDR